MKVRTSSTESGWCFTWQTPAGHWRELEFLHERNRWLQRFKLYDPDVPDPPWTPAQRVELPAAVDQDDAEAIDWFELECSICGYTGRCFPARGVVVHALLPNCRVQWDDDEPTEVAA